MLKQQTKLFNVRALAFPTNCLENIDKWMLSVFQKKASPYGAEDTQSVGSSEQQMYNIAHRGQQLVNIFLQFANIPAFYAEKNIQIQITEDNESLAIALPVPLIEMVSEKAYEIAIQSAFSLLTWMVKNEVSIENTKRVHNTVEKKIRIPMKNFYVGGKSTLRILQAANDENIPFIHLGYGIYQLGWGGKSHQLNVTGSEQDSITGVVAAQDKVRSAKLLHMYGLPAPQQIIVNSKETATNRVKELGWPVVVKPINCDRGEGVVIGIKNNRTLSKAFEHAKKFSPGAPIILEKEVAGVCHRIFIVNGSLLYVSKRWPISVIGDGQQTVSQLIASNNAIENEKPPWLRSPEYPADLFATEIMKADGFSLEIIPAKNQRVQLRPFESNEWGGSSEDVTNQVHPANLALALKAAKAFGLCNVGIDLISTDISVPWYKNDAVINEVNFSPELGSNSASLSCIPSFINNLIKGDGRIPIEVFVGGNDALKQAKGKHQDYLSSGINNCLTTANLTLYLSEGELHMPLNSALERCRALLLDKKVEAIVLVLQTDEYLMGIHPFDQISSLTEVDNKLTSWKNSGEKIATKRHDVLCEKLKERLSTIN
ncbi:MAG: hypothetical protein COB22_08065 [Cycloclasticus sp.]|nr:MAG: hypothetical protein COB22_08065 [Cycloclasticus sp.]